MKLRFSFLVLSFLVSFNSFSQKEGKIDVKKIVLDNGLTVYLNEDHNATKVFGAVAVNAGSKNDPASSTGIAHYLEHMLFKGTQTIGTSNWQEEQKYMNKIISLYDELGKANEQSVIDSIQKEININTVAASKYNMPNELDKLVNSIGGTGLNAFTSDDMTFFHNSFPSSQINKWIKLYSERLINPVFRSFQSELEVVYEEKNRSMDNFIFKIFEELNQNMFKGHPYGTQTTLGSVEHLKKPSLTNMYKFYKKYYVASNMALVLVGNFDSDKVIPIIKEEFGRLPKGEHAITNFSKPKGFAERILVKRRYTPVKLGILGYKTVPENNKDNYVIEVIATLLNNENQTGLLDKLTTNNKLMISQAMQMPYKDDGALIIYYLPKIMGQSLGKAEALVMAEVNKIKMGEFPVELLENAKRMIIQDHEFMMEDIEERGIELGSMYVMGKNLEEFNSYVQNIKKITKNDIKEVSSKYFGEGYFALQSKMGFPKKTKLNKPGFDPVKPQQFNTSDFAKKFEEIKGTETKPKFIDFKRDVEIVELGKISKLYANKNPYNDLFSMTISYNIGKNKYKELEFLTNLLDISGTNKYSVDTFKTKFADLGITYYFSVDKNNFNIELEGNQKGIKNALSLIKELLDNPSFDKDNVSQVVEMIQNDRKMTYKEPSAMGNVLLNYALFKQESEFLTQPSIKEYKKYTADSIKTILKNLNAYSADVYYTGNSNVDDISKLLNNTLNLGNSINNEAYIVREAEYNSTNKVYFVNDKNSVQSQVYFCVNGNEYESQSYPYINAFNTYFGRGFSGLVMQEIREYRSMAYSAYGYYLTPYKQGSKSSLIGYIGCQADKTIDAIEVMDSLITKMPQKPERIDMIRDKLYLEAQTAYPDFRDVPEKVAYYKKFNINQDPNIKASEVYNKLKFDDIYNFYLKSIAKKPLVITIYGDKKKINIEELQKYGKFIELSKPDIYYY
jgi:predicted Zn-dependent peptidase